MKRTPFVLALVVVTIGCLTSCAGTRYLNFFNPWRKIYAPPAGTANFDETPRSVVIASNGDILIAGSSTTYSHRPKSDLLVMRLSSDGNLIWQKTFGNDGNDYGVGIVELHDGRLIVNGLTETAGLLQPWVLGLTRNGDLLWGKIFGRRGYAFRAPFSDGMDIHFSKIESVPMDQPRIEPANAKTLVLVSTAIANSFTNRKFPYGKGRHLVLTLMDHGGQMSWQKAYAAHIVGSSSSELVARSVKGTSDGGFIVVGEYFESYQHSDTDGMVMKLSSLGQIEWARRYRAYPGRSSFYDVEIAPKFGYIVSGLDHYGEYPRMWVAMLQPDGTVVWNYYLGPGLSRLPLYPYSSIGEMGFDIVAQNTGDFLIVGHSGPDMMTWGRL